eukprot:CAMPEP_0177617256 /NCGR_PEP_ID=MMETSP0419_2-20121207/24753_1 /TAXON_ID=582737 /ORGANISM="Tetraselmis sp., Strain GSL018" /LENGTH=79 /DNA_ID=CAMNT_0019115691 /DNA_START=234 /DNA_END=469 /DNA_ORIENTATION=-
MTAAAVNDSSSPGGFAGRAGPGSSVSKEGDCTPRHEPDSHGAVLQRWSEEAQKELVSGGGLGATASQSSSLEDDGGGIQ